MADHQFCSDCWGKLRLLTPPWCAGCNLPFAHDRGDYALCGTCLEQPPVHAGVRAAVAYDAIPRALILRLKYGRRIAYAETVARHMIRLMPETADLLIPVPLHRRRLWWRGFNQAALIAQALTKLGGPPSALTLLQRHKSTPMLRGLGRRSRAQAVKGAFQIERDAHTMIKGRSVVLVDDVYTSGATTNACTKCLLHAGASSVTLLCWARVIDSTTDD